MDEQKQNFRFLLIDIPLFKELDADHISLLCASCEIFHLGRGESLFERGSAVDSFYYLIDGLLKIYATSKDGSEKVIHIVQPGESFAEAAMFLGMPVPVSTQAMHKSAVLSVPKATILKLIEGTPTVALQMLAGMSMRTHRLIQEIKSMSLQSATERVVGYLLQLCGENPESQSITLPATKQTIASLLNLTPETLSRTLAKLEQNGLISVNATQILIPDCGQLRNNTLV